MNRVELRTTLALASVFASRMLGMFLILPVFVLYADTLPDATPLLVGFALGVYGLTQGLLQLPFGWVSDRWGRKPVIAAGLFLFAAGSVMAALASDIAWTIAGRALQGAGAVAAVITALLADLTRDEVRTRAMAVIGVSIGASFAFSLALGPVLDAWIGVRGIFWLTGVLALVGVAIVVWVVPSEGERRTPKVARHEGDLATVLRDRTLWPLYGGIFVLHFVLTAVFVALPPVLEAFSVPHGRVYLSVVLASAVLMLPAVLAADRPGSRRPLSIGAVALLGLALTGLTAFHAGFWPLVAALVAFFTAFNFLEANLPAAVSRAAPDARRGAALGVYSSCQFLGAFGGGIAGGAAYGWAGPVAVFGVAAGAAAVWLLWALGGTDGPAPSRAAGPGGA